MSTESLVVTIIGAATLSIGLIWLLVALTIRQRVLDSSQALAHLENLNSRAQPSTIVRPPIAHSFALNVNSKQKFDRFDLHSWMAANVIDYETWFVQEMNSRLAATNAFNVYHHDFEALAGQFLGKSSHPRIATARFASIEKKNFYRRKLKYPTPTARISSTVKYTSPKGQNSYSRGLTWSFDELRQGIQTAQENRARQSTTQALRQRERSLMTNALRVSILKRDGNRCQMCGASAMSGATLHVDHIRPVSWDGRTVPENLQTLCEPCNLGKSNRFVG